MVLDNILKFMEDWEGKAITILTLIGIFLSGYLTMKIFTGSEINFCITGSDCDFVNGSRYSKIFGIPVSAIGLIGYGTILIVCFLDFTKKQKWKILFFLSTAGFAFSLYLTYLEIFILNAICSFCIVSAVTITLIFILLLFKREKMSSKLSLTKSLITGIAVICAVFITLYLIQSPSSTDNYLKNKPASDKQINLAKHLGSIDAVMYGSYTCGHCNSQKSAFGSAFQYIKYVECNNKGPRANPTLCFSKGIRRYPTWEIKGKYYEGYLTMTKLSELSGFSTSK